MPSFRIHCEQKKNINRKNSNPKSNLIIRKAKNSFTLIAEPVPLNIICKRIRGSFSGNMKLIAFYLISSVLSKASSECLNVETTSGKVKGKTLRGSHNSSLLFYGFRGIPYAQPPLGVLRFKVAEAVQPWNKVLIAGDYGNCCLHLDGDKEVVGSEDCLNLNIFTKDLKGSKPVMVWIHGGAYIRGCSKDFGPDYLMEEDIVLVTLNYRLGIFGFFTTKDDNAPGNLALKDILLALKWIRDNIASFGGNPDKVTIFGESSGCSAVSLLQISPQAQGLFQQVIAQSGSVLSARYIQRNPLKYTEAISRYFNITTSSSSDIVKGLQEIDPEPLTKAAHDPLATGHIVDLGPRPFYPIIEDAHPDAFLTTSPYKALETFKITTPLLIGYTTGEASLGFKEIYEFRDIREYDTNMELFVSPSFNDPPNKQKLGEIIRDYFLGNSNAEDISKFSNFLSTDMMVRPIRKTVDFVRQYQTVYLYRFSYEGTHTSPYPGVGHAEELQYLFVQKGTTENLTEDDLKTRKRMVRLWSNFARDGSPTPRLEGLLENVMWRKCDENQVNFLDIGKSLTPCQNPNQTDYEFWIELFEEHGIKPFVTY